ncbi:hypothetical protein [Bacillus cereus]|uniref:Uncharacterized protein n=2 Tax=Bacillus cereus group TaxID=86661 RepID=A0ABD7DHW1_BACCE|nr:hypothetical protein [Bacillus cereus]PGZ25636.1 hypothetical protein COE50_26665 [Bacillus anthracis]MDA2327219.1 hypothetical protein [Bacillus cereus]MDA2336078.1 hypothetical protein [Bacillus cereus]PFN66047.1 hypothetical protein COJ59_20730 [Bacillus cereus]QRY15101.1 hypothetical protein JTF64_24560 [Bacillus cereus]
MTTTTKKTRGKASDVHKQLPEIIAKAREKYGEDGYNIEYDYSAGEWKICKKIKKGDGGLDEYEKRHKLGVYGIGENSVLFGGGLE